ncbi:MAG: alpha/beta hydrolase [Saccharospirillaceae bacterium]|nr:alpha/beta hydrolase [Pseudomonadales bacterium]NRB78957.1 alpha/beta hydrolase [Saccharospirillaceae bacterium]
MIKNRLGWLILLTTMSFHGFGFTALDIPLLQSHIPEISPVSNSAFFTEQTNNPSKTKYQQYFFKDLDNKNHRHLFYKYRVGQYEIVAQVFLLDSNFETVVLSHGYLDHAGFNRPLVNFLLSNNYNIIVFDQPGHGLSSGLRSGIDNFSTYNQVITQTINHFKPHLNNKLHVIGHSTGNVGIMYLVINKQTTWNGETIMLSPLIRSKMWGLSKFFYKLGGGLFNKIPRTFRNNSHNKTFKKWLKTEPFVIKKLSKNWIDAHHTWEKEIQTDPISQFKFTIIQGQDDIIVDYKYNQKYLNKHYPNLKLIKIKHANHHLINETKNIQIQVFESILLTLKPSTK